MEATEINGGRFYARPLHHDDRIDDSVHLHDIDFDITKADEYWHNDQIYSWAICEQTNVDMVAFARYYLAEQRLDIVPIGDPDRVLPNDPDLEQKTVADAVHDIRGPLSRWCALVDNHQ